MGQAGSNGNASVLLSGDAFFPNLGQDFNVPD
jgi:hypothetical protein